MPQFQHEDSSGGNIVQRRQVALRDRDGTSPERMPSDWMGCEPKSDVGNSNVLSQILRKHYC